MLRLEHVSKIYPTGEVLRDISWELKTGDRIGLVGVNGAGKSTQFKIIAEIEDPSSGQIVREGSPRIAYLQQEFDVNPKHTVKEELFQAFEAAAEVLQKLQEIEELMTTKKASEDDQYLETLVKELGNLQNHFEGLQGYELEARVEKMLPNIGFNSIEANELVGNFSGGWQMRIALGKIMLQDPDILLLDEPTNHLDLNTIEWLETYLSKQASAMVVISHDRTFLDRICNKIISTERGISKTYLGNYTSHLEQKKLEQESNKAAFERQQKDLSIQQEYIDRFRASATRSSQAKSREKLLEKIERIEKPLEDISGPYFRFPPSPRSGKEVAIIKNLTHCYGDKILFLEANLEVMAGEKIALVGPNGAGKSTLLRLIMGMEKPDEGSVSLGKHKVLASYFEQNQAEALNLNKDVINTIFEIVPDWSQTEVRSLLGSFGLSDDAVFKEVANLSGGEKARLALALMLVKSSNLLLLDEPTNHLDIPSKEMLEEALNEYAGSAIIISHDRYFVSKVANKIVELKDGELILYHGNFNYYQEKKREERLAAEKALELAKKEAKRLAKRKKKKS